MRRLAQSDVVVGEHRLMDDCPVKCISASSTHVGYEVVGAIGLGNPYVIRRDVYTAWPVIEEAR